MRKEKTIESIKAAYEDCKAKGVNETDLSIRTIKRHWDRVTDTQPAVDNRVTVPTSSSKNRVTSSAFASFKRRAEHSTMGVYKCPP